VREEVIGWPKCILSEEKSYALSRYLTQWVSNRIHRVTGSGLETRESRCRVEGAPIQHILRRLALLRVPFSCYWTWPIYCLTGSLMSSQLIVPCILFLVRIAGACPLVNKILNPMLKN
jgi:hypothetical protein